MMMPFSSSLFKFISDSQQELDNSKDGRSYGGGSSVVSSRRSSNSSFEFVNCNNEQPLLSEREAIKIKARVCGCFFIFVRNFYLKSLHAKSHSIAVSKSIGLGSRNELLC